MFTNTCLPLSTPNVQNMEKKRIAPARCSRTPWREDMGEGPTEGLADPTGGRHAAKSVPNWKFGFQSVATRGFSRNMLQIHANTI